MVANKPDPPVYLVRLPQMVSQSVAEYPSLAEPFYSEDKAVDYPHDACILKMVYEDMPLRKPPDVDKHVMEGNRALARHGGSNTNANDVLTTLMTLLEKFSAR